MTDGRDEWVAVRGITLHVKRWRGDATAIRPPFVLVHGLASNHLTWTAVARRLQAAGHQVVAIDQRGHGQSDKPETGYDFGEVTADQLSLIEQVGLTERPILAGQSWGGNVVLDFAARYPDATRGVVLVDGGTIELSARPEMTWERVAVDLRPPPLAGMRRDAIAARIRANHPSWTDEGIEATLGNFEALPDGTIRPWLSLERHLLILRALWEHRPSGLYDQVRVPVLVTAAETADPARSAAKRAAIELAAAKLARCRVQWFADTDHDIHVHRPDALTDLMLGALADGFFEP